MTKRSVNSSPLSTPASPFSAPPPEKLLLREITALDAESAAVLENIRGLLSLGSNP